MRPCPLPQGGVADRARLALRLAPLSVPWEGTMNAWGPSACALPGPGDNGEETKTRTAAMMLSRTGRDRDPACRSKARSMRAGRHHGVVWRVRPTKQRISSSSSSSSHLVCSKVPHSK